MAAFATHCDVLSRVFHSKSPVSEWMSQALLTSGINQYIVTNLFKGKDSLRRDVHGSGPITLAFTKTLLLHAEMPFLILFASPCLDSTATTGLRDRAMTTIVPVIGDSCDIELVPLSSYSS